MDTKTRGTPRTRKATFNLHSDVLAALDMVVAEGKAESKNALVERAIAKEVRDLQRQARRAEWHKAAEDPLFVKDIEQIDEDFRFADADNAGSAEH